MKYLISNFKENKTLNEVQLYEDELRKKGISNINVIMCPSFPFLHVFKGKSYTLGAQDVSKYQGGSYTGEVSAKQLASLNVKYVLVGHSERRLHFKEKSTDLVEKIGGSFANGIIPILCIGESKEEHNNKKTNQILEKQLATVMNDFTREELKNLIIAYEPVWAIGTGIIPTTKEIAEIITFIKTLINNYYELDLPVIYGGSITKDNINNFLEIDNIAGFLVGGTSLEIEEFGFLIDTLN